jgi:ketosteroid isomerase-like protein
MKKVITFFMIFPLILLIFSCDKNEKNNNSLLMLSLGLSGGPVNWVQDAYFKASNADAGDYFGYSIAVSGDTIVVGSSSEASSQTGIANTDGAASADNTAADSGAVYVFKKDASDNWIQDAYLKASNAEAGDQFGCTVAIYGNTIVVGAKTEASSQAEITNADGSASADNSASGAGAAYVFRKNASGNWVQDAYLKASNSGASDYFGHSVAVSGDTIVVGAFGEDSNAAGANNTDGGASPNNLASASGAAYVFKRNEAGNWIQDAYLKAANVDDGDQFGWSVSASNDTIVVSARYESSNQTGVTNTDASASGNNLSSESGAAYVFKKDEGGNWIQDAYLKASNANAEDWFGNSVSISGTTIVIGADKEDGGQSGVTNTDGTASADNSADRSGAVYVFRRDASGDWIQDAYLKASNAEAEDDFGESVCVSGDIIVVSARREDGGQTSIINSEGGADTDNSGDRTGAAYVFKKDASGNWIQDAYLKASNGTRFNEFGWAVSVGDGTVLAARIDDDSGQTSITNADGVAGADTSAADSGAVYVFSAK